LDNPDSFEPRVTQQLANCNIRFLFVIEKIWKETIDGLVPFGIVEDAYELSKCVGLLPALRGT